MANDTKPEPDDTIPANDNRGPDCEAHRRLDKAVLSIARVIGRRIAREQFEALRAANDDRPRAAVRWRTGPTTIRRRSMIRVALYARYSSDNQRDASIEDQLRQCREYAARQGWTCRGELFRPRHLRRIPDPSRHSDTHGRCSGQAFDVVLSEALDRISRDQEDVAAVFKRIRYAGVSIVTLSEGEITELHVGLKGTMNALFLKDLSMKTHRGIRGRVEAGKIGGGNAYGYRVVKTLDARGEPIRGEREIIEEQAEVVRRIFREYVAGKGPQRIAADLNRDGIPSPTGGRWSDTSIRGNRIIGSGTLNCELYVGVIRWNRQRQMKNPDTGRCVLRLNPESEWIRIEVPEFRIVPDELWNAAKVRQDELTAIYKKQIDGSREVTRRSMVAKGLNATHRPRTLLSGLLVCGCCGGAYARRGQDRYACTNHALSMGCDNSRTVGRRGAGSPRPRRPARPADGPGSGGCSHARLRRRDQPSQPRAPHVRRGRRHRARRHRQGRQRDCPRHRTGRLPPRPTRPADRA